MTELRDLCSVETGEYIKKCDFVKGIYPVYGGGSISKYINQTNKNNSIVINKDGISANCVQYIYGDFFLNHHGWTLKYKSNNKTYIIVWLLNNQSKIYEIAGGSVQKGINQEHFYSLKIPIPRNTALINNLEKDFKKIETLQQELKDSETKYKQVLQELSDDIKLETIAKDTPKENNNTNCDTKTNDQNTSDEPIIKKKTKKIVKKEHNSDDERETKHIVSDEPTIKKKSKKVVKKEHNSDVEHIISDEPTIKKKIKKVVKKEHTSDNEQKIEHIVSDEPTIKKKSKKVVKNEHNSDVEHIISDEPAIKKKSKKVVKKEHNSDVEHIISDEPIIKKKYKKIVKQEYNLDDE